MHARILSRLVGATLVSTLGFFTVGAVSASAGPPVVNDTAVTRDLMVTIGPVNATGKRVDASKVMVRVRVHATVLPDGTLSADFSRLSCI